MKRKVISIWAIVICLMLGVATARAADADIVISEIMMNAIHDTGNVGEWFEIYNKGTDAVDLAGWRIQDNSGSNIIDATMCPGGNCQIPAGACWLVAVTPGSLQAEFASYANPNNLNVDPTRTIFLGNRIGSGLANTNDRLILRNSSGTAVDCYSWDASGTCAGLTYTNGGNGVDAEFDGSDGQSVANVQGIWSDHQANASPYNCINTAAAGPTAVSLQTFQVQPGGVNASSLFSLGLTFGLSLTALGYRWHKAARAGSW